VAYILGIANGSRLPGHQKSGTLPLGPDDLEAKPIELSERQLDDVAGGTKEIDKASAKLFQSCATGEHIKSATLTF
jgi:Type VI secretion system effector, Hcp